MARRAADLVMRVAELPEPPSASVMRGASLRVLLLVELEQLLHVLHALEMRRVRHRVPYVLYDYRHLGVADGMPIARVLACRYSK